MKNIFNHNSPILMLILMSIATPIAFNGWSALLNNFVVERANFTGVEIGILQSIREIPGFLAFSVVFVLLIIKEQSFSVIALALMGLGVSLAGYFPSTYGLYFTTIVMSTGFHYFETIKNSLSLQWLSKEEAPQILGRLIAVGSITSLILYAAIWCLLEIFNIDYVYIFLICGIICIGIALYLQLSFPIFKPKNIQHKNIILRKKYSLYYILIFLSGARRQIFIVFAAFLMVEKFKYSASQVTLLFLINYLFNWVFAEKIGKVIHIFGEKKSLTFEYIGLIIVFISYAIVTNAYIAAMLYVIDHMFFALAIAINTYFQKIADPKDIASSAGVSFTINHIAAIFVPVLLGFLWIYSHSLVFFIGSIFALLSLIATQFIPSNLTKIELVENNI
ncbi:MAG: MFS transporter [Pelagibacteraceae bacterium]|nr:MFS transporter [Pelagibacteraceae bacterium]MBT3902396.1 MFS transporter [Pelagibacteraceae bacterium]MBT4646241.1 MFS transporter [Pelagibacteraceae bacterium]MBT4951496.1 MFS transporter [Pelagibacteraceae bacterium]MBT6198063.1 MFS transporter [Pelagibacteraceae bacterium]